VMLYCQKFCRGKEKGKNGRSKVSFWFVVCRLWSVFPSKPQTKDHRPQTAVTFVR
jgi:hypothetical protein